MKHLASLLTSTAAFVFCSFLQLNADECCATPNPYCCEWSLCDGRITLEGDWLFWKVQEDQLSVGSLTEGDIDTYAEIHTLNPKFQYSNGFRLNLGYELPNSCWDFNACYSYIPTTARTSTISINDLITSHISFNSDEFPILESLTMLSPTSEIFSSRWSLSLSCLDIDIGRVVALCDLIKIRPHAGFRAMWINQKQHLNINYTLDTETDEQVNVFIKEHFQGYGVEAGLWASWQTCTGIAILGHVGGSVLYSNIHIPQKAIFDVVADDVSNINVLTISDTIHSGIPSLDYFVGFQYCDLFCNTLISLVVGWEQHVMLDANRLSKYPGNLITQGLTLGLEANF